MTGADVAATDDLTGTASLGGDWDLEQTVGEVETESLGLQMDLSGYDQVLPEVDGTEGDDTITGTAGSDDTLVGDLGDDVYLFQDNWGTDTVVENSGAGTDTLDFSAVTENLTITLHDDGSVSVSSETTGSSVEAVANIENIITGSGTTTFVYEDGGYFSGTIDCSNSSSTFIDLTAYTDDLNVVVNEDRTISLTTV